MKGGVTAGEGGQIAPTVESRGTRKNEPRNFFSEKSKKGVATGATAACVEKLCRVCGNTLTRGWKWGNWSRHNQKRGYRVCRSCDNASYKRTVNGRLNNALAKARTRGRRLGLSGTVSLRDLLPLPTVCPLLGLPLHYGPENVPGKATFDRIDPTRGYEPGNVWIVSARANTIKNNASLAELKTLVANLEFHVRLVKPE